MKTEHEKLIFALKLNGKKVCTELLYGFIFNENLFTLVCVLINEDSLQHENRIKVRT